MNRRMRGEGMSVLIKGFEMPKDCRDCPMEMFYMNCGETRCRAENKILAENFKAIPFDGRPDWCPLVEVPAPHGDLIDRDALNIGEYEREDDDSGTLEISIGGLLSLYHKVIDAPTVIEAEETE